MTSTTGITAAARTITAPAPGGISTPGSKEASSGLRAADLDPDGQARLSYQQAEALISASSGGATLCQLRHSALTRDADDDTGTPVLMARSGHTSVRSLAKYA